MNNRDKRRWKLKARKVPIDFLKIQKDAKISYVEVAENKSTADQLINSSQSPTNTLAAKFYGHHTHISILTYMRFEIKTLFLQKIMQKKCLE